MKNKNDTLIFIDEIQDFAGYDLEIIKNLHEIGKVLVCLKQLIFNIKSSKITV